ncbi:MAG: PHP domain-containing protein, partial [Clostridia bacterium]|nr:PHP domain-containing protein [Clostridia bacterium]
MQLYDLHTHTTMSDGEVALEDLVEWERGMGRVLGVSDHLFSVKMFTERDVAAYIEALKPYAVYRGLEANMEQNFALPDALDAQIDYVIASVHSMPDGRGGFIPLDGYFRYRNHAASRYVKNYSPDLCRWYLAHTLRMIEKSFERQRVDILGHATVIPCCGD